MSEKVRDEIEASTRKMLEDRLGQITDEQRKFFWDSCFPKKHYPNGVPEEKLITAIDLCDRTIKENIEEKSGASSPRESEHDNGNKV